MEKRKLICYNCYYGNCHNCLDGTDKIDFKCECNCKSSSIAKIYLDEII